MAEYTRYDLERIMECVDVPYIAETIGMDIVDKGKYKWILCPGHLKTLDKEDHRIGSAHLTNYGYFCYACARGYNVFDMVSDFLDISFPESIELVASLTGDKESFRMDSKESKHHQEIDHAMTLKSEDLKLIGLFPKDYNRLYFPKQTIWNKEIDYDHKTETIVTKTRWVEEDGCTPQLESYYLLCDKEVYRLRNYAYEDPEGYRELIARKAKETCLKYLADMSFFESIDGKKSLVRIMGNAYDISFLNGLRNYFYEQAMKCHDIYLNHMKEES